MTCVLRGTPPQYLYRLAGCRAMGGREGGTVDYWTGLLFPRLVLPIVLWCDSRKLKNRFLYVKGDCIYLSCSVFHVFSHIWRDVGCRLFHLCRLYTYDIMHSAFSLCLSLWACCCLRLSRLSHHFSTGILSLSPSHTLPPFLSLSCWCKKE